MTRDEYTKTLWFKYTNPLIEQINGELEKSVENNQVPPIEGKFSFSDIYLYLPYSDFYLDKTELYYKSKGWVFKVKIINHCRVTRTVFAIYILEEFR